MKSGIYEIVNKVNGKRYIGSAVDIKQRWVRHRSDLILNQHGNDHLQSAWNKYGEDNFEFKVLSYLYYPETLIPIEQLYLDKFWHEGLYNVCPTAGSMLGCTHSEETKVRLTAATKKRWEDPDYRDKVTADSKKKWEDPDYRDKVTAACKKRWEDPAYRAKGGVISKKRYENPKYKANIAAACKKRWEDPAYRAKMSDNRKKKWEDPEYRAKRLATFAEKREIREREKLEQSANIQN